MAGKGPDLVVVAGSLSHVELGWETPATAPIYARLSRFARMITFDKRGMGLSDSSAELPTLEERMDEFVVLLPGLRNRERVAWCPAALSRSDKVAVSVGW